MPKSDTKPMKNATAIIEKFGGIRPMATKLGVAVTTVQGWKKRDVIPANRRDTVIEIAAAQNIDLSGLVDGNDNAAKKDDTTPSDMQDVAHDDSQAHAAQPEDVIDVKRDDAESEPSENDLSEDKKNVSEDNTQSEIIEVDSDPVPNVVKERAAPESENITTLNVEKTNNQFFMLKAAASVIAVVVVGGIVTALLPSFTKEKNQSSVDEYDVYAAAGVEAPVSSASLPDYVRDEDNENQTSFKGLVPEDWSQKLVGLKQQAAQAKKMAENVASDTAQLAQDVSQDVIDASGIEEQITTLQTYTESLTGDLWLQALMNYLEGLRGSEYGRPMLSEITDQLSHAFKMADKATKGHKGLNDVIDGIRKQTNGALGQAFKGVPTDELESAAMLFAMTQVRSALNRGDANFDSDVQLLMNMVGEDDAALRDALVKLTPHARSGVLSFDGLQKELRAVTGEVVASSLNGEDVSLSEKLSARANNILKIEKDGELLTGTETQAKMNHAENLVRENRIEEAVLYLRKNTDKTEGEIISPWISKAEGVIAGQKTRKEIDKSIALEVGEGLLGGEKLLQSE